MHPETWLTFLLASGAISVSPGAGAVASMTSGVRNGFPYGAWTAVGQQLGLALQIAVAGIGLGAVLAASELAFEAVRWFGVLYLVWLGVQQWRAGASADAFRSGPGARQDLRGMVLRGFLVNASNPKATVFMLAVLPQFLDPALPLVPQYTILSATMIGVDIVVMGVYTLLAARLLAFWREPKHLRRVHRAFGVLFIGVAALLASFRRAA